jgi:hypothetical protein
MRHLFVSISLLLLLVISCKPKTNDDVLSEKEFASLLIDMHIADALVTGYSGTTRDSVEVYRPVFVKHKVSKKQFDRTFAYYTQNPKKLTEVYNRVLKELTVMEGDAMKKEQALKKPSKDKNLWESKTVWKLPHDGGMLCLSFNIPISEMGRYNIKYDVRMFRDDQSQNPEAVAWFWKADSTKVGNYLPFKTIAIKKNGAWQHINLNSELKDSTYTHLKGMLLFHSNTKSKIRKHAEIKNIQISFTPEHKAVKPVDSLAIKTKMKSTDSIIKRHQGRIPDNLKHIKK